MENSTQPAYSEVIRNAANETKSKNDDKVATERQIENPQILSVVMLTYHCQKKQQKVCLSQLEHTAIHDTEKNAAKNSPRFLKSEILGADKGAARMGTGQDPGERYRGEGAGQVQIEEEEAI